VLIWWSLAPAARRGPRGPSEAERRRLDQYAARGADQRITDAIDSHVHAERDDQADGGDGPAGALVPAS
jgi:hypothetical protein